MPGKPGSTAMGSARTTAPVGSSKRCEESDRCWGSATRSSRCPVWPADRSDALYDPSLFPLADGSTPTDFSIEPDFLSTSDIIPGQALHRPEIRDADLYEFTVSAPGRISIETFAQRLLETSLLDTDLKLWKFDSSTAKYELVARNADFYGDDSFIGIDVGHRRRRRSGELRHRHHRGGQRRLQPRHRRQRWRRPIARSLRHADHVPDVIKSTRSPTPTVRGWTVIRTASRVAISTSGSALPRPKIVGDAGEARSLFVNGRDGNNALVGRHARRALTKRSATRWPRRDPGDIVRLLPDGGADGRSARPRTTAPTKSDVAAAETRCSPTAKPLRFPKASR